jgi:hypothetical protein
MIAPASDLILRSIIMPFGTLSRDAGSCVNRPRRLRLLLSVLPALVLTIGLVLPSPAWAFSDVDSAHPYAAAIDELAARGILSGRVDGTFGPDEPVARCQFAKLIVTSSSTGSW